jgi:SAM-dependent methyltransferase
MSPTRWDDGDFTTHLEALVWTASPVVRRYLHVLASGDPACDWLTYVGAHHLPPVVERALVLGCGSGWLERALAKSGRFRSVVACDFAEKSVERARGAAEEAGLSGIEYRVVDLEREALPVGPYDAIFANDVLHHIADLEGLYGRICEALHPAGRLLFNEYVGPNRFQYPEGRMEIINRYFRLFPERLRWDPVTGRCLRRRERVDPLRLAEEDPTEAVRSADVLPLARRAFDVETEYPYGGGLLNPLLFGVIANFRQGDREDDRLLEVLCGAEDRLTRGGIIEPDFCVFVGRRPEGLSPMT